MTWCGMETLREQESRRNGLQLNKKSSQDALKLTKDLEAFSKKREKREIFIVILSNQKICSAVKILPPYYMIQ